MIKRFASLFSGSDGYQQVVLDLVLPDEIGHLAGAKAGFYRDVFNYGFPRNNASDVRILSMIFFWRYYTILRVGDC